MKIRRSLLKDTVSVQTYAGEGAYGPVYAAAVSVNVNADTTRRLVRSANGDEVVSELTLQVHPDDESTFAPESKLTYGGRASTVLSAKPKTFQGNVTHVEVACS